MAQWTVCNSNYNNAIFSKKIVLPEIQVMTILLPKNFSLNIHSFFTHMNIQLTHHSFVLFDFLSTKYKENYEIHLNIYVGFHTK